MLKAIKLLPAALILSALLSCNGGNEAKEGSATISGNDSQNVSTTVSGSESNTGTTIFKATLEGSREVPPNSSTATGTSTLTYDNATKTFTDVTSYSGLTPSMGHIHKAIVGANGPVIFPFTDLKSPITYKSAPLTDEEVTALFQDSMYVNLHTTEHPDGEIRGQLIKQ